MSSQEQFLNVIDRDEAEARFRAALRLEPLGVEQVPLADALGSRAGRRCLGPRRCAVVRSLELRWICGSTRPIRSAPSELAPRRVKLLPATIDAGMAAAD